MQLTKLSICFLFAIIFHSFAFVEPYRFLCILPTTFQSHFIFGSALMKGIAQKGHEVYVISPFPQKQQIKNYHDVPFYYYRGKIKTHTLYDLRMSYQESMMAQTIFQSPDVQQLLKSNLTFDAVIVEVFYSEALFGFSEYFNAPLIGLSTFGFSPWTTQMIGSPSPSSFVPSPMLTYSDRMTFMERFKNIYWHICDIYDFNFFTLQRQEEFYKIYFPNLKRDMYTVRRNAAALLINSHVTLGYPRPTVPNHISVGGLHINRHNNALPKDLDEFITNAKFGVIYFSMGTNAACKDYFAYRYQRLLKAFYKLKYKVLWKLDDPEFIGFYRNVLIRPWFPQQDILAHENVKVFITQGGLLSVTESIYYATPIVGLPVLADQFFNMHKVEKDGIGIYYPADRVYIEDIADAAEKIINNQNYSKRIKVISKIFRDQPMAPLDLAIYWVERIARQKGAKHLHCAGLELNFFQYFSLDSILAIILGLICLIPVIKGIISLKRFFKTTKKVRKKPRIELPRIAHIKRKRK